MSERKDAIVIGGGVGGLVAATYLARAGRSVLLLEAETSVGGACRASSSIAGIRSGFAGSALYALDPRIVTDLDLRELKFAVRDMLSVALREDGRHLVLGRDAQPAFRAIAPQSSQDAQSYRKLREEIFALAHAMRPFWWEAANTPALHDAAQAQLLPRLAVTSAASYLSVLESDALRSMLAFDAGKPLESGSALALVWRAAQEMCGLQGAVATIQSGPVALIKVLTNAVRKAGVDIRTRARVERMRLDGNSVTGVVLDTGEEIAGRSVLSGLTRRATLLNLAPTASAGFAETQKLMRAAPRAGEALVLFLLNAIPDFGGANIPQTARFVIADRLDDFAEATTAVRDGILPDNLLLEVTVPTAADPALAPSGQHVVSVRVTRLPLAPKQGWPALTGKLFEKVVTALERHTPHLREGLLAIDARMPVEEEPESGTRLMTAYAERINTPIEGLFLCGASAEPMNAISGRAGRLAAGIANAFLARKKGP
ncbi:MAG: NAD(P)/FAD-dependent oxidoreductase [Rhizomicrobium sp.]